MNILGCLDYSSEGDYYLEGVHVNTLNKRQLADIRNQKIGFVFQGFNLLPRTSAWKNVELPLLYDRRRQGEKSAAKEQLKPCGASHWETGSDITPVNSQGGSNSAWQLLAP